MDEITRLNRDIARCEDVLRGLRKERKRLLDIATGRPRRIFGAERQREAVCLIGAGWTFEQIAQHHKVTTQTARSWVMEAARGMAVAENPDYDFDASEVRKKQIYSDLMVNSRAKRRAVEAAA